MLTNAVCISVSTFQKPFCSALTRSTTGSTGLFWFDSFFYGHSLIVHESVASVTKPKTPPRLMRLDSSSESIQRPLCQGFTWIWFTCMEQETEHGIQTALYVQTGQREEYMRLTVKEYCTRCLIFIANQQWKKTLKKALYYTIDHHWSMATREVFVSAKDITW